MVKARQKGVVDGTDRITLRLEPLEGRVLLSGVSGYALQTRATFNGTNGRWPTAGLVMDGSGNLYGTTYGGGDKSYGTVFKIAAGSNTITPLGSFNGSNGANPYAGLIVDGNGNLYGTSSDGGHYGYGTVFEVAAGSNAITTLASFDGTDGGYPYGGLIMDGSGNLYGTTYGGCGVGYGTVFELAAGSNTITTLVSFDGTNGAYPSAGLIMDGSGNLYGTTYGGCGVGYGTVFEVAAGSNTMTTLASFNWDNGSSPYAGLTMDGSGNLYGTTAGGGANGEGTVFEVAAGSNAITTLASFDGTDGGYPYGGLIMDGSGNLYGTTYHGGAYNGGTAFEVVAGSKTITTLASFDGTNGKSPWGGLTIDESGNLYGTTCYGGANDYGIVFQLFPVESTQLAFVQQPTDVTVGTTITPPLTVAIEDADGNVVVSDSSNVTLTITGGTLNGTLSVAAVNGVATFSDLSALAPGTYTLQATDDPLTPATSETFDVFSNPIGIIISPNGHVQVSVCDVRGSLNVSVSDIKVTWGTGDAISSITLGGTQPMGGLGLAISGASSIGSIKDGRKGLIGDVSFIAADAPIKSIQLKGGMSGFNVNGLTLGGLGLPIDIDGDGDLTDAAAIYSTGAVGSVTLTRNATGDIWIGGKDSKGTALSSLSNKTGGYHGDLVAAGNVGKVSLGGTFGSSMDIQGSLAGLTIRGGNLAGTISATGTLGKISVSGSTNKQTGLTTGGDMTSGARLYAGVSLSGLSVSGSLIGGSTDEEDLVQICSPLISNVSVGGDITDSRILAGTDLGADWAVGGTGEDADFWGAGIIGKISVRGDVHDSLIGAGVSSHNGVLDLQWLQDNVGFIAGSMITSGTIGGSLYSSWPGPGEAYGVGAATVGSGKIGGAGEELIFSN